MVLVLILPTVSKLIENVGRTTADTSKPINKGFAVEVYCRAVKSINVDDDINSAIPNIKSLTFEYFI